MSWPWQRSIQARIVGVVGGLLLAVLVVVNLGMAYLLAGAELEQTANHLQIQALVAARNLQDPLSSYSDELHKLEEEDEAEHEHEHEDRHEQDHRERRQDEESLLPGWARSLSRSTGAGVLVSDLSGRVLVGEDAGAHASELEAARKGEPLHRWTATTIYASVPLLGRQGRPVGLVRLAVPRATATSRSLALSLALVLASLAALSLALLAATNLSRRLVRPLRLLEERANEAARGNWSARLEVSGDDELASLSRAFASMLSELQSMLERQRLFVSHASHELRTPLTRIKLRTEALATGALQDPRVADRFVRELDGEVDRLTRLTDTLLDLGRLEERVSPGLTEPLQALREAGERVRAAAEERHLTLEVELPSALPALTISREALDTVLDNLLDNALKYTPGGGRVSLKAELLGKIVEVTVIDSGPGIPAEHLPHVFERFYRVDPTRGARGFGLGLALVKAAVTAAGGKVSVSSSAQQGCKFVVSLPAVELAN